MKYLFVTVGTSALTNEKIGSVLGGGRPSALQSAARSFDQRPQSVAEEPLKRELIEAHLAYWQKPGYHSQHRVNESSAELVSAFPLIDRLQPDATVLLASGTKPGRLAAHVNQQVLLWRFPNSRIEVCSIEGIDIGPDFIDVFKAVRDAVDQYSRREDDCVDFNVTGGYKFTLLYIAALALGRRYTVWYQHETSDRPIEIRLFEAAQYIQRK